MPALSSPLSPVFCLALLSGALSASGAATLSAGISQHAMQATALAPESATLARDAGAQTLWVYVGTYTSGKSKGIYLFHLDLATGKLAPEGLVAECESPSFLAIHPNHRFLYAVNEVSNFGGMNSGAVSAFAIEPKSGHLTRLNQQSSRGAGPCHLSVDHQGKDVLVANYGSGSVAVLPIQPDGRLGPATAFIQHEGKSANPQRQEGPHAHSINVDATNRFAFAADLGLDKILVYRFDAARGTLTPNDPAAATIDPGSGPRHFAFHPNGRFAYVINEMGSTVTALAYDAAKGTLKPLQTLSTLPEGFTGNSSTAEVQVHPSGKFLYGSNRGHDSIAIFKIDPDTGRLTPAGHQSTQGKTPRNFGIDPTGQYLLAANQDSDTIVVFRIDPATGALAPTGQVVEAPKPVCVKFLPLPR
jgi:6-phosphogluconolactonase